MRALFGGGHAGYPGGRLRRLGGAALVWVLFAVVLAAVPAAPASAQNQPPVYSGGNTRIVPAPPGTLVSLPSTFNDPDGDNDNIEVTWKVPHDHGIFIENTPHFESGRVYIKLTDRYCDLAFRVSDPIHTNVNATDSNKRFLSLPLKLTLIGTDEDGASGEVELTFNASWGNAQCHMKSAVVSGRTLTLGYHLASDESLKGDSVPPASAYTVTAGAREISVDEVSVSGSNVVLTLSEPVPGGATVRLAYDASTNPKVRKNTTNSDDSVTVTNVSTTVGNLPVLNENGPLGLVSATGSGSQVRLGYDETLDSSTLPPAEAFSVTADGADVAVTGVSVDGSALLLALESPLPAGAQRITVAYSPSAAGANYLRDASGDPAPGFGAIPVNRAVVRGSWFTIPFVRPVQNYENQVDDMGNFGAPMEGGCTQNFTVRVDGEVWPAGVTFAGERDGNVQLWRQVATASDCADPHSVLFWVGEGRIKSGAHKEIATGQQVTLSYGGPWLKPDGTFAAGLKYTDDDTPVPAFSVDVVNPRGTASVDGNRLEIEFGVALDESVVLDPSDFEVSSSHAYGRTVPVVSASISGSTVTLMLAESIPNHATVSLFFGNRAAGEVRFYRDDDGEKSDGDPLTSAIKDLDGNELVYVPIEQVGWLEGITTLFAYPSIPVKVTTPNTAPVVVAAGVDFGSQVLVRFNEQMDTGAFASGSAFTVTARLANGATRTIRVDGVPSYAGSKLRLHLASAPPEGAVLSLSYRKPSESNNQLKDAGGMALESFSGVPVNNGQPTVTGVEIVSDPGSDGVYTAGEKVRARVSFSDNVIVNTHNGTPRLRVHLGDFQPDLRWASFESGWGSDQLVFAYTVTAADVSDAGGGIAQSSLGVKANSLETGGGEIWSRYVRANRSAVLSHPGLPRRPDPAPPAVTAVAITSDPGSDRTYALGDVIEVGLTFSDPIFVDLSGVVSTDSDASNDRPTLAIDLGNRVGDQKLAYYQSGHGTNRLTFAYTVTAADTSTGGVEVLADSLRLRGGQLRSHWAWSDHHADISHRGVAASRSHLVDPAPGAPTIMNAIGLWNSSTTVTLTFSKELDISYGAWPGSIAFEITVDGERRRVARDYYPHVDYDDGRIIRFTMAERLGPGVKKVVYTKPSAGAVGGPLRDLFGNEVESFEWPIPVVVEPPAPPVTAWLWGATMSPSNMPRGLGRGCSQDASLCRYNTNDVDFEYEGTTYEITALRQAGHILRDTDDDDSFYFALDRPWPAALRDDAALCVGDARLVLADAEYQSANRIARWAAEDHEGALANVKTQLAASPVTMRLYETANAADACPVTGQQLQTSLSTLAAPTVASVAIASDPGDDGIYGAGDAIEISVTFTGAVDVTGSPKIDIDMDPAAWGTKQAAYQSGTGTATLTFAHTVVEPNYSSQGIAVLADTLALNGGAIATAGGADADLSHTGLAHDSDHRVDWQTASDSDTSGLLRLSEPTTPAVTAVAVTSDAGSDDTYRLGDVIRITVTFSEAVDVTGIPRIDIDMDPAPWGTKQAAYQSGTGTTTLVFTHTVAQPNYSSQGIAVLANTLALNSGAIQSVAADIDANLAHTGLAHNPNHKVDWQQS